MDHRSYDHASEFQILKSYVLCYKSKLRKKKVARGTNVEEWEDSRANLVVVPSSSADHSPYRLLP